MKNHDASHEATFRRLLLAVSGAILINAGLVDILSSAYRHVVATTGLGAR